MENPRRNRPNRALNEREEPQPLKVCDLFYQAGRRLLRFPIATLAGIAASLLLGSLFSYLPDATVVDWFLRFFVAFSSGIALFLVMSALFALRNHRSPPLGSMILGSVKYALISATLLGLPLFFTALLLPMRYWRDTPWVAEWSPYAFLSLGSVLLVAVLPAILAAWPYSIANGWPLGRTILVVWRDFEAIYYSPMRLCLVLAAAGFLAAWTPIIGLMVIPALSNISSIFLEQFTWSITNQTDSEP